jgi:hypothetical protein
MACRSSSGNSFNYSRTGSLPASVRKKIKGIFWGCGTLAIVHLA